MTFNALHQSNTPLLLCNVWDIPSTRIATDLDFHALGTSSAAIATSLGKEDGEHISFDTLFERVKGIIQNTDLPVSVDIEAGYSNDPHEVVENIKRLHVIGVCGINIEDSTVRDGIRTLNSAEMFSEFLSIITNKLNAQNINTFINVRTDTFLLGIDKALDRSLARISAYENAGADGMFIPCVAEASDIKALTRHTPLPINVMCMPNLPNFEQLKKLGVKRISMGNFVYEAMQKNLKDHLNTITQTQSFNALFK